MNRLDGRTSTWSDKLRKRLRDEEKRTVSSYVYDSITEEIFDKLLHITITLELEEDLR